MLKLFFEKKDYEYPPISIKNSENYSKDNLLKMSSLIEEKTSQMYSRIRANNSGGMPLPINPKISFFRFMELLK